MSLALLGMAGLSSWYSGGLGDTYNNIQWQGIETSRSIISMLVSASCCIKIKSKNKRIDMANIVRCRCSRAQTLTSTKKYEDEVSVWAREHVAAALVFSYIYTSFGEGRGYATRLRVLAISLRSRHLGAVVILLAGYTARGIYLLVDRLASLGQAHCFAVS